MRVPQDKDSITRDSDQNLGIEDIIKKSKEEKIRKEEDIIEHILEIGQEIQEIILGMIDQCQEIEDLLKKTEEEVPQERETEENIGVNQERRIRRYLRNV